MIALLVVSVSWNVILLFAALVQRQRLRAAAVARCADCPFVTSQVTARIPVPVYEEPKTLLLNTR